MQRVEKARAASLVGHSTWDVVHLDVVQSLFLGQGAKGREGKGRIISAA